MPLPTLHSPNVSVPSWPGRPLFPPCSRLRASLIGQEDMATGCDASAEAWPEETWVFTRHQRFVIGYYKYLEMGMPCLLFFVATWFSEIAFHFPHPVFHFFVPFVEFLLLRRREEFADFLPAGFK